MLITQAVTLSDGRTGYVLADAAELPADVPMPDSKDTLDAVIRHHFPDASQVFYAAGGNFQIAAVEDREGDMWRVWSDGDTQRYAC